MVAAPQYGTFTFVGLRTRKTYVVDAYHSDVAAAYTRFDGGAGASSTSPEDWTPPEPVQLVDYSIVTGMTDTTKVQLLSDNQPTGDHLRYSIHLTTLANRPRLNIRFPAGHRIRAAQRA